MVICSHGLAILSLEVARGRAKMVEWPRDAEVTLRMAERKVERYLYAIYRTLQRKKENIQFLE